MAITLMGIRVSFAQNPALAISGQYWDFSNLYFLPTIPASGGYHDVPPETGSPLGPSNMYNKPNGKPLFFIVDGHVFTKNGFLISRLADNNNYSYSAYGYSEIPAVSNPINCNQYFLFTTARNEDPSAQNFCGGGIFNYKHNRPYYAIIDMSQQTPSAPVGEKGKNLPPRSNNRRYLIR